MLIQLLIQNIIPCYSCDEDNIVFDATGMLRRFRTLVLRLRNAGEPQRSTCQPRDKTSLLSTQSTTFCAYNVSFLTTTLLLQLTALLFLTYSASHISPLYSKLLLELSRESSFLATKMQRKELEEQLEMLKTTIQEKQPSPNVISILKKLQMEVVPTEEILRVWTFRFTGRTALSPHW